MIDEGYVKFDSCWKKTGSLEIPEIDELIRWRAPLYSAGLIGHFADLDVGFGNLSARTGRQGLFVISGTQTGHLAELRNEHFSLVTGFDLGDNIVYSQGAAEPSSESMTHAMLYALDPGIRAVVHIHSDALWLTLKGQVPTTDERVAYGTSGMAREFARLSSETDFSKTGIAVMAGHEGGLISTGTSVEEAAVRLLSLHQGH